MKALSAQSTPLSISSVGGEEREEAATSSFISFVAGDGGDDEGDESEQPAMRMNGSKTSSDRHMSFLSWLLAKWKEKGVQPAHPVRGLQRPVEECTKPHAHLGAEARG